jgi:hypothetical protein
VAEGAAAAHGVRGRVAVAALHALFGGADVQCGELGVALDELAARDAVSDEAADVPVQRGGVCPELDEHVRLLLGEYFDFTDVDRRRAELEHVESEQPQQSNGG